MVVFDTECLFQKKDGYQETESVRFPFLKRNLLRQFAAFVVSCALSLGIFSTGEAFADASTDAALQKAWSDYNTGKYNDALTTLQPMALDGNATAQLIVGLCYENGLGVEQNSETAMKWYELASEQKNAPAQVRLAYCYALGLGVPKDAAKAVQLIQDAAGAGDPEAQFTLALYYSKGMYGLEKNLEESFAWMQKSAEQGYGQAERYLGACYEYGVGTKKDATLAQEWYAKAKAKGLEREGNIFATRDGRPQP